MAVQTAASTKRESNGSLTLYIITFTSVANGDTYVFSSASAPDPIGYWCNGEATTVGSSVAYVAATNTFTFYLGATGKVTLYLLVRS